MTGLGRWVLCAGVLCLVIAGRHGFTKGTAGAASAPAAMPTVLSVSVPSSIPSATPSSGAIALHADRRGHFMTSALVNGRTATMLVDTGATSCAFREEDAESLGIRVGPNDFTRTAGTANGTVRVAPIRIRLLQIGPVAVRDVEAVVIPRGRLGANLLGMSFLSRLREFNVAGARITLRG